MAKEALYSLKYDSSLINTVPEWIYQDFYKKMEENGNIYAIMFSGETFSNMYFSPDEDREGEYKSYIFYKEEDALDFLPKIKDSGYESSDGQFVVWRTKPTALINVVTKLAKKSEELDGKRKLNVVLSTFYNNEFVDIEVMWTNNQERYN